MKANFCIEIFRREKLEKSSITYSFGEKSAPKEIVFLLKRAFLFINQFIIFNQIAIGFGIFTQ